MSVKYPDVTVQLTGQDGNAFAIIARIRSAIKEAHGLPAAAAWASEAMDTPSYDALLNLAAETVNVT